MARGASRMKVWSGRGIRTLDPNLGKVEPVRIGWSLEVSCQDVYPLENLDFIVLWSYR